MTEKNRTNTRGWFLPLRCDVSGLGVGRKRALCLGASPISTSSRDDVSRGDLDSCNLPTYINTMLRFAFRSPYERPCCIASPRENERKRGSCRGPGGREKEEEEEEEEEAQGRLRKKVES